MQLEDSDEIFSFDTEAHEYFNQYELGEDSSIAIVTGPESGFSDEELELIKMQNIKKCGTTIFQWSYFCWSMLIFFPICPLDDFFQPLGPS